MATDNHVPQFPERGVRELRVNNAFLSADILFRHFTVPKEVGRVHRSPRPAYAIGSRYQLLIPHTSQAFLESSNKDFVKMVTKAFLSTDIP